MLQLCHGKAAWPRQGQEGGHTLSQAGVTTAAPASTNAAAATLSKAGQNSRRCDRCTWRQQHRQQHRSGMPPHTQRTESPPGSRRRSMSSRYLRRCFSVPRLNTEPAGRVLVLVGTQSHLVGAARSSTGARMQLQAWLQCLVSNSSAWQPRRQAQAQAPGALSPPHRLYCTPSLMVCGSAGGAGRPAVATSKNTTLGMLRRQ